MTLIAGTTGSGKASMLWKLRAVEFIEIAMPGLDRPGLLHVPTGKVIPPISGGEPETPEERAAREGAAARAAQEAADARRAQEEAEREGGAGGDGGTGDGGDGGEPFDQDRAMRTIRAQRAAEQQQRQRADQAEAELRQLRQAQETEQQRIERERDEARQEAERTQSELREARLDIAIRDVAAQRDVPASRIRRLSQLVQADGVQYDDQGNPQGIEDAVDAVLQDFPELAGSDGTGSSSPGNPPRQRQQKEMTIAEARKLATDDPDKFNELFEAGKIPAGAMGGR